MGKVKYLADIKKFFKESPVVNIDSLKKFINKKDKSYIYLIVNNLLKKGEIKRLTKGYYTIHEDPSLIVFCFKPSYLGLQNALSFHNLWEQETNPLIITARKIRQGRREVFGRNVIFKNIDKKYLFGFDYYKDGDFYLLYSDIEKTFIDLIYFKQFLDKEVIENFKNRTDRKKLSSYLKAYPIKFRKKVLKLIKKQS
jgi:predicted transcriptional regulator of viral defense system